MLIMSGNDSGSRVKEFEFLMLSSVKISSHPSSLSTSSGVTAGTTQEHQDDDRCTKSDGKDPEHEHEPEIALVAHSSACGHK